MLTDHTLKGAAPLQEFRHLREMVSAIKEFAGALGASASRT
jgi:hypothetical protein